MFYACFGVFSLVLVVVVTKSEAATVMMSNENMLRLIVVRFVVLLACVCLVFGMTVVITNCF